jgi:integrase
LAKEGGVSALHLALQDYLRVRRALGSKLEGHDRLLTDFVAYLEAAGAPAITTELALRWATLPGDDAHPAYLARRLRTVRGFARHLSAFDSANQVPPVGLLPEVECRATPYLYTEAEVTALMAAARSLRPALRAATYETLIGLLVVTGCRIGELIRLDRDDVDWDEGVLRIRDTKFGKSREAALHATTLDALRAYAGVREELCPRSRALSFFLSPAGTRLVHVTVEATFTRLVRDAGLAARSPHCRPRLHDFRHSFAVTVLLNWYRAGVDVEAHLPRLSTYLGHAQPANTYWYISAVPELLSLAAERREQARGTGR